jgi:hypothetical protein
MQKNYYYYYNNINYYYYYYYYILNIYIYSRHRLNFFPLFSPFDKYAHTHTHIKHTKSVNVIDDLKLKHILKNIF